MLKNRKSISIFGIIALLLLSLTSPAFSAVQKTQLVAPKSITIQAFNSTPAYIVKITWPRVPNNSGYMVRIYGVSGNVTKALYSQSVGVNTENKILSLPANIQYRASVQTLGVGNFYSSPESGKFSFTTTTTLTLNIAINAGDAQSATVGTAVTTAPSVIVKDSNSNPVSGVSVSFAVATGGGSIVNTTSQITDASGIASSGTWTLGTSAGTNNNTLTATSGSLSGSPITFTATAIAGGGGPGSSCAGTEPYQLGSIGPGCGIIYYVDSSANGFACGPTLEASCHYLEVAPEYWYSGGKVDDPNGSPDPSRKWAITDNLSTDVLEITNDAVKYNNYLALGLGYKNSNAIVALNGACLSVTTCTYAAGTTRAYTGGTLTDWYLPTAAELNLLCLWGRGFTQDVTVECSGETTVPDFVSTFYWSSSEFNLLRAWLVPFSAGIEQDISKNSGFGVRPIRAF